jgi:hypothetical protein
LHAKDGDPLLPGRFYIAPPDALHAGMPRNAIEQVKPDYIATAAELPALLDRLTKEEIDGVSGPGRVRADEAGNRGCAT